MANNLTDIVKKYRESGLESQVDFKKFYLYSIITHSTALEGSTLSEIDNQLLFDEGIPVEGKPMIEQLMNLDLRDAYLLGYSIIDKHTPIDVLVLKKLASAVMKRTGSVYNTIAGVFDSSLGDLRLCNVTAGAGARSYMSYLKVPDKIKEFTQWLSKALCDSDKTDIHAWYSLSFEAHYRLVTIHPWVDGNGRTTRLLMNMIQYMAGLPQSRILPKDKAKYIKALVDAREKDDINIFINAMMQMHVDDLEAQLLVYRHDVSDDRINAVDDRIKSLRDRINDSLNVNNPDALIRLCEYVSANPKATASEIGNFLSVSIPTVNRYLKILRDANILRREGARKNGHWTIL